MDRRAVVTGGAGGIGGAIVRALSASGHDVAILDREGEFAVDLAEEHAVRTIAERLGPRDVLVHAAAAFDRASLEDLEHRVETARRRLPALRGEQGGPHRRRPLTGQAARRARVLR